jgi:hypothetical protein
MPQTIGCDIKVDISLGPRKNFTGPNSNRPGITSVSSVYIMFPIPKSFSQKISPLLFYPILPGFRGGESQVSLHTRPLNSIILIKEFLLENARDFMKSRQLYADRGTALIPLSVLWHLTNTLGIPFRRGYLLYGAPGSGNWGYTRKTGSESYAQVTRHNHRARCRQGVKCLFDVLGTPSYRMEIRKGVPT